MEGGLKKKIEARPAIESEVIATPERQVEQQVDTGRDLPKEAGSQENVVPQAAPEHVVADAPAVKDPYLKQIEDVLSEGLGDLYNSLPPNVQPAFRVKGEEVANAIASWASEAKLTAKNVLKLIREWLGMVPRMNKHYLEQESKIKTDRIMHLHDTSE